MLVRAVLHNATRRRGGCGESAARWHRHRAGNGEEDHLAANSSVSLDFPVEFVEPGEAKWVWRERISRLVEACCRIRVESKFKVVYPTPLLREIQQREWMRRRATCSRASIPRFCRAKALCG